MDKQGTVRKNMKNNEKATIVVKIAEVTAGNTSKVPLIAAFILSSPFSNL